MRKKIGLFLTVFFVLVTSQPSHGEEGKEFFTSVVYGTVAGTLVGVATLAFTADPGDNLMNIARGASIGLYCGILLGVYLTYWTGDSNDQPQGTINPDGTTPTPESSSPQSLAPMSVPAKKVTQFKVYPFGDGQEFGVGAELRF